jgi:hypothetical protein
LVHLDYRLACLRYAVGILPAEDLYYTNSQQLPPQLNISDRSRFAFLLLKARTVARKVMRRAEKLDAMLNCSWRQQEVQSRIQRIEETASAME